MRSSPAERAQGKTTLLNVLSRIHPGGEERIVTIEDAAELQLRQDPCRASSETRPANIEGKGAVMQHQSALLVNALRMRPDRIIVGEVPRATRHWTCYRP